MLSWGLGREVFIRNKQTPMKGSERKQGWAAGEIGLRWKPHRPRPAWQEALEQTDAAPQRPPPPAGMLCPCQALGAGGLGGHDSGQAGSLQQRQTPKGLAAGDVLRQHSLQVIS